MTFGFQEFAIHSDIFRVANGGYTPALNYYRALIRGLNVPAESKLTPAQQKTHLPTLFIGVNNDPIVDTEVENQLITNFSSQPTLKSVNAGHWPQLQVPDQVNSILKDFFAGLHIKGIRLPSIAESDMTSKLVRKT